MTEREQKAMDIVRRHSWYSAGVGLFPFPLIDGAAVAGIQLKLIHKLATDVYEIPFSHDLGKSLLTALVGGSMPAIGTGAAMMLYAVPVVGPAVATVTVPAVAGAATYAVGRVFTTHFEAGGTMLDFDADKMRDHFKDEFEKAKKTKTS